MFTFKLEAQIQNIMLTNALLREQQNQAGVAKASNLRNWERVNGLTTALLG